MISCASAVRIHELLSVDVAANPFGENILSSKVCRSITNAFAAPLADAKFVAPISLHKMDSQRVSRAMMANKHSGACQKSIWPLFLMHYAREFGDLMQCYCTGFDCQIAITVAIFAVLVSSDLRLNSQP